MKLDNTHLIVFIVGAILGLLTGFFSGKAIYDRPITESVKRDTVRITDTIARYYPQAIDGTVVRYVTKFLPIVRRDTIDHVVEVSNMVHDTVAVEVPITSKHYGSKDYDAWVSGYEPSLDSIKVYKETQYITETITKYKRKPWGIGISAGFGYDFKSKTAAPFIGIGISYDIISF